MLIPIDTDCASEDSRKNIHIPITNLLLRAAGRRHIHVQESPRLVVAEQRPPTPISHQVGRPQRRNASVEAPQYVRHEDAGKVIGIHHR